MRLKHKHHIGKPNDNEGLEFIQNPVIEFNSSDYFFDVYNKCLLEHNTGGNKRHCICVVDNGFKR